MMNIDLTKKEREAIVGAFEAAIWGLSTEGYNIDETALELLAITRKMKMQTKGIKKVLDNIEECS
jgi:hypothetical protein